LKKHFYKKWDVPAAFVGHPLANQLPLENPILQAKEELGLDLTQKHIALLPGSRRGEIEKLGPLVLDAAKLLYAKYPNYRFVIPAINDARKQQIEALLPSIQKHWSIKLTCLKTQAPSRRLGAKL
jgi:lipid-A-disaccharide synthase